MQTLQQINNECVSLYGLTDSQITVYRLRLRYKRFQLPHKSE